MEMASILATVSLCFGLDVAMFIAVLLDFMGVLQELFAQPFNQK